ncbi:glycosyltransferase family 71 protein [Coniochaeta sp. 2T2.1]|nr:glycosyltransferase family 71 protein [Coniochaeta sp. 2T2.1]
MVLSIRPRILLAVALTCVVIFVTFQSRDAIYEIRQPNLSPDRIPSGTGTGTPAQQHDDVKSPNPGSSGAGDTPYKLPSSAQLVPNAHKLPGADSFKDHFEAVTRLKGVSMAEAKATCTWAFEDAVDFQYGSNVDWVVNERTDDEVDMRRKQWQDYVDGQMIPWEMVKDKFEGRGLVILAGNQDTTMRLKVILRRLKVLGSKIAIELHYWDDEMSDDTMKELAAMYSPMTFNDLSKGHNIIKVKKDGFWINYQLKSAAVVNSKFAEPLLLDSDNVPVIDPATLYDSAIYKEYHTVFWPDIARSRPQNPAWAITNTPCRMDEYEQESGQMLVDKRRYWYHLQLAAWLNNEHGKYYNEFLLGDKDMFRFAWHALKTDFGKPKKWLTSVGAENEGYYCGHSFAQHHPDNGSVAFMHGGLVKSVNLDVMRWNKEEQGGYFRHYKRAPTDEDPAHNVRVGIKFDKAGYWPGSRPDDTHVAMCTDMEDVPARDLEEILPGWEKSYEEVGGFWMLEKGDKAKGDKQKSDDTAPAAVAGAA